MVFKFYLHIGSYSEDIKMVLVGSSFMVGEKTHGMLGNLLRISSASEFLVAMHYGSLSGGGGWHSLYNLIRETNAKCHLITLQCAVPV